MNQISLLGRVGKDPELKTFDGGGSQLEFTLATSETWKDRETGERRERADWHNIVIRGDRGKALQQYIHKGDRLGVTGKLSVRQYEKNGEKRSFYSIVVNDVDLAPRGESGGSSGGDDGEFPDVGF